MARLLASDTGRSQCGAVPSYCHPPELDTHDTKSPHCDIRGIQGGVSISMLGSIPI